MTDSPFEDLEEQPASETKPAAPLWRVWFGVRDEVSQPIYFYSGIGLMLFKYAVELAAIYFFTGNWLLPWDFLNPHLGSRAALISSGPEWLGWFFFAWNLPFVWIAFSMSVRRAVDAGMSPWTGLWVLVPILNLLVMLGLAVAKPKSDRASQWEPRSEPIWESEQSEADPQSHAMLSIATGILIGLLMLGLSVYLFDMYGATLFFGTPILMGAVAGFVYNRPVSQSWTATYGISLLLMLVAGGALLLFALEGAICLIMAAPLVLPLGLFGGAIGKAIADSTNTNLRQTLSALAILPLMASVETLQPPPPEYVVLSTVEIDAPPEEVWPYIIEFPDIPPAEDWYFDAGIACPLRARIEGEGVGAIRYCEFTTGSFVEPITVWDNPHRLAFDVTEQPEPMRELSPYRHVHPPHMKGETMRSQRGEFRLIALPGNRTRLEGRTWYTFQMFPQAYWTLWSNASIHRIHERVLGHLKNLAEGR